MLPVRITEPWKEGTIHELLKLFENPFENEISSVYEGARTSDKCSFLIAIKFKTMLPVRITEPWKEGTIHELLKLFENPFENEISSVRPPF